MIKEIFIDRIHDNIIMDVIIKLWVGGLFGLFVVGMVSLLYGIISGQADLDNATFGVFDTLG